MPIREPGHRARPSPQRTALAAVLAEHSSFRSVAELYDDLRARGHKVGLVTVYRHLEAMSREGTVTMTTGHRGEARYRLCPATDRCPIVCRRCQRVVDTDAVDVTRWAETTAAQHGFVAIHVTMMVTGVCLNCHD